MLYIVLQDSREVVARSTVKVSGVTDISKATPACAKIHHCAKEHQVTVHRSPHYFGHALDLQ
jgi:hypothetical protein